jgi:uncharacterized OsmC-like protein
VRLLLEGETRIRVDMRGEGLDVESVDPHVHFSPLHMLAASLATCTVAVLVRWAQLTAVPFADLEIDLSWDYVDDPYRVGQYDMTVRWPSLPEPRRTAALHVAEHCTVEHTLTHPPRITTRIEG